MTPDENRPSPEALLREAAREERGRLKLFLGASPGVGKTYEMLADAGSKRKAGVDVVIGVVETHGRAETEAMVRGLDIIPRREIDYQGRLLTEMDVDAILARRPQLVLVDELAHTNAPGSRHPKRYQDVEELLAAGINVYSTVNIQHLESLNDVVASFTRVRVRETVPDRILDEAEIEVVDLPPDELIERLRDGKVYVPEEASRALGHFFSKSNLSALRELALRRAAQTVDAQMLDHVRAHALAGTWAGSERIVVAVSELPGAPELVRAAKRLADGQHAPWSAVHIETPRIAHLGHAQKKHIADTMNLASQLGATVVSMPATSVIEGLKTYLADARATQLVVGKSARSRWFELQHGSVVDRLVRETPGVAVHVLPLQTEGQGPPKAARSTHPFTEGWGTPRDYILTFLMIVAITFIGRSIVRMGNITDVALLYLLPVMLAATRFGLKQGVLAGIVSALAYNFFFLPPIATFTIADPANLVTFLVLIGVAFFTSRLASRTREHAALASASAKQNAILAGFARQLVGSASAVEAAQMLCGEVARLLDVDTIFLRRFDDELKIRAAVPPEAALDPLAKAAADWADTHGQPAGRGSETLTSSDWLFYPVRVGEDRLGVFGVSRTEREAGIRPDQLPLLLSLVDQAALSLQRERFSDNLREVARLRERDKLRDTLFSSLGHDLRTPMTSIQASIAVLKQTPGDAQVLATLDNEAQRLQRFLGNLLDMTRIEAGAVRLAIEPVDLTDAVATAVHDLKHELASHEIRLNVPAELPLVRVDPQLFHHCLINLLENAAKYGGEGKPVSIDAKRYPDEIRLSVLDEGLGIPPAAATRLFETFQRIEGSDRTGGTGLGLAIVKGFAEAMGMHVSAANRDDRQGASLTLHFPDALLVRGSSL